MSAAAGLPKSCRILKRSEFVRAQRGTTGVRGRFFVLVAYPRGDDGPPRLGITASRKAGNAPQRNRSKRLVREWFRTRRARIAAGTDLVIIVRRGADAQRQAEVCSELDGSLKRALGRARTRAPRGAGR